MRITAWYAIRNTNEKADVKANIGTQVLSQHIHRSSPLETRYADSLLDLAKEKPGYETIDKDVKGLLEILRESADLKVVIDDPRIQLQSKKQVLANICETASYHSIIASFVEAIADNGRLEILESILKAVVEQIKKHRGVVDAQLVVANDLDKKSIESLKRSLVKSLGKDVQLHTQTDKEIMGGLILEVGALRIDDSVQGKLIRLEREIVNGGADIYHSKVQNKT